MAEQQEHARRRHESLEVAHAEVRGTNQRLESKLDHLEAVFLNTNDGTAEAFSVGAPHHRVHV